MAVYHPQTHIVDSAETFVAPGVATIIAEGMALVRRNAAPAAGVQPSVGDGAEVFVGFSHAGTSGAPFNEPYAAKVQELVVPATGTVTLDRTPVAGQVAVFDITANAAVPITGGVAVTGNQITGLTAGNEVRVTYKYSLTIFEARTLYGNSTPGGYSGDYVGQIGLLKRGTLFTDQIDTSANWATAKNIVLAAGGQITTKATVTGTDVLVNGYVVAAPSVDYPFLALEFSAA